MAQKINSPELLCPAGSPEAFRAAIEGGADAIYVGGTAFNARMNAKNFTPEQMREAISLAHAYGVKVYVAANTLIYDRELPDMLRAAEDAYLCGADALIVADLGAARSIKERIPIALHASTQVSGHNASAAKYLAELGFCRMVCAREMGREELRSFIKDSPIEAEVFVHGALCVCHSGQCLFSSLVGGRSGNRGECAQPCRLPFKSGKRETYPLSLKDLSLARHVPELCEMGIASFKIEGRMKSPEYVRDVARIWRRLIDERRGADSREMDALAEIFSRGGFTDGYYEKKISRDMLGIRSEADKESSRALTPFTNITRKVPLSVSASIKAEEPMSLTLSDGNRTVTVTGACAETAHTSPLTAEAVKKNLLKLGGTPYEAKDVDISLHGDVIAPLSAINALRRQGIELLMADTSRSPSHIKAQSAEEERVTDKAVGHSAVFYFPDRIPKAAHDFFDLMFVPLEKYNGETKGVALPPVIFDSELDTVRSLLLRARQLGATDALVGNIGHLELLRDLGMIPHGDLRLNVANTETALSFSESLRDIILSPELSLPRLRDIKRRAAYSRVTVWGRIPLMVTEKCVGKELGDCRDCRSGASVLTDRRGVRFPVLRTFDHRSIIFNSLPIYMADKQQELLRAGLDAHHFIFSTESEKEISAVIKAYNNRTSPSFEVRRIK